MRSHLSSILAACAASVLTPSGLSRACLGFLAAVATVAPVQAAFVQPDGNNLPWIRGVTPGSLYAEWNIFTSATAPNAPDVGTYLAGLPANATAPSISVTSGTPIVTGSGNLYSPSGPMSLGASMPGFDYGPGTNRTVILQIRTLGTELDLSSVLLNGSAASSLVELFREPFGGPGGFIVETLFRWDLTSGATTDLFTFSSLESSLSLDRVAIDSFAVVPAPGVGVALVVFGACGRRRRRA